MYSMRFYDTAERGIIDFIPKSDTVTLYVCGITPYDSAHLGHIFTFLTYDLLQRRFEDLGHNVKLVRNITDVDEPIFKKAAENMEPYEELARREIDQFQSIMSELNFRDPDAEPLASEYIGQMSAAVKRLLSTGFAYKVEDDIYFDVSKFPKFGSYSGFSDNLLRAFMRDRGGDPERPNKRHPLDFLLWRAIKDPNDTAVWDSSVGPGRPGWHIECSVMSSKLLGAPIDIHGGGTDLIFPHHECEIAQSESLGERPLARHWLHVAPLLLYGEKMSKSLGNLVFARDLLRGGSSAAVRLALMHYHYQTGGEWREDYWRDAKRIDFNLRALLNQNKTGSQTGLPDKIRTALDNNLDGPSALAAIKSHIAQNGNADEVREALDLLGVVL